MAKYQGKRSAGGAHQAGRRGQRRGHGLLIVLAVILVLLLAAAVILLLRPQTEPEASPPEDAAAQPVEDSGAEESAETAAEPAEVQEEETGLSFPYTPEESGLEITSLFSSDIFNPDGGNETVDSLASLELTNTSGAYLVQGSVTITLTDGTVYTFEIDDLPAGGQMMAFSTENASYDDKTGCESIIASTQLAEGDQLMADQVSCSVEGTVVTLTNLTQEDLGPLTVVCHDSLDETAFGGISYHYQTEVIPAGGSVTVEALDCMVGQPAVVRIAPES